MKTRGVVDVDLVSFLTLWKRKTSLTPCVWPRLSRPALAWAQGIVLQTTRSDVRPFRCIRAPRLAPAVRNDVVAHSIVPSCFALDSHELRRSLVWKQADFTRA